MNLKRAMWVGVLTYAVSFIVGLIPAFFMNIDTTNPAELPQSFFIIGIVISVILSALFSLLYFKDKKIKPSAKEGFYFGLVLIVIGFVMDIVMFTLGAAASDIEADIFDYYSNPAFWIALVLFVATTTSVGALKGKKK